MNESLSFSLSLSLSKQSTQLRDPPPPVIIYSTELNHFSTSFLWFITQWYVRERERGEEWVVSSGWWVRKVVGTYKVWLSWEREKGKPWSLHMGCGHSHGFFTFWETNIWKGLLTNGFEELLPTHKMRIDRTIHMF